MSKNNPDILRLGNNIKTIIEKKGYKTREVAHDSNLDVENLRKIHKRHTRNENIYVDQNF